MREEMVVGKLRNKNISVDVSVHLLRHIVESGFLKGVRREDHLSVRVIADDACHNSGYCIAIGVHMHDVFALS